MILAVQEPRVLPIPGFEDPFSAISHLLGALVFLLLAVPLVKRARGNHSRVALMILFSFAIVFLLSMSGTFHLLPRDTDGRYVMQIMDHAAIFFLIASSITAVHGVLFRGFMRWGFIALLWMITSAAITLKVVYFDAMPESLGLGLYIGMGWTGGLSTLALWRRFGFRYVSPIFWGGIAYTVGAIADYARSPVIVGRVIEGHEIFHVAILVGLGFHWYFAYGIADGQVHALQVAHRWD